ncbi:DMT family transporter, partial [Mycobacterium sp.]|uniref:DMT family transporter n=1 Tax=Mycobacterium sp. TaxID=1785 RepID=UPI003BAF9B4C
MTIILALASAISGAVNALTQRVSSRTGPSGSWWRLAKYLIRQRLWLIGLVAAIAAFVLQAAALRSGRLSVVQPLLVTELVFVLVLRRLWLRQSIRTATWASAALTCAGLTVFLLAAQPRGGNPTPTPHAWIGTISVFGGATVVMTLLAARGSPVRRAALYAASAAISGALAATFVKTTVESLALDGPASVFTSWPVYALAVSAIASAIRIQAALHVGPLTVSQPIMVVLNPIVSIWISVWLFAEYFTDDKAILAAGAAGFAALIVGVVLLTTT